MKHIMLVCNAGMSTSMLMTKMIQAAQAKGIETEIWAVPVAEVETEVQTKTIDVLLVGPQVKFMLNDYKASYEPAIKVDAINMMDYGTMNGEKVLDFALDLIGDV